MYWRFFRDGGSAIGDHRTVVCQRTYPWQPREAPVRFCAHDLGIVVSLKHVICPCQHNVAAEIFGEFGYTIGTETYGVVGIAFGDATCRNNGKRCPGTMVILHTGRLAAVSE
jgi:hypothetical protein